MPILDAARIDFEQKMNAAAELLKILRKLANYVEDNHENLMEGDFSLSDFVDRFGPRLAHLNTMLAILRPLAAAKNKSEG